MVHVAGLLGSCLDSATLVYVSVHEKQIYGMAMGSPVSAVVANLVMEELESSLFKQDEDWLPRFW